MDILLTCNNENAVTRNLVHGIRSLGHNIDLMTIPQNESTTLTREMLDQFKTFDFVHDMTNQGALFNFLKLNGYHKTLYHCGHYFPMGDFISPIVVYSKRQAAILEYTSSGFEPEPMPPSIDINRYTRNISPYYVYPDIDISKPVEPTNGEKTAFVVDLSPYEVNTEWFDHIKPLLMKYDIISIMAQPSEAYTKIKSVISIEDEEHLLTLLSDYKNVIYFTTYHIPFPHLLFYPLMKNCRVMTTSYGGCPELITHGMNGFITNNVDSIEKAMDKIPR